MRASLAWSAVLAIVVMLAAGAARGAVRNSASFFGVPSIGAINTASNAIETVTLTGGYTVRSLHVTATLQQIKSNTMAYEAQILVTPPSGTPFVIRPFTTPFSASTAVANDLAIPLSVPAPAGGTWTFRFFESNMNGSSGADSTWSGVMIAFDDAVGLSTGVSVLSAVGGVYAEIEPNDQTLLCDAILSMSPGESLTGSAVGSDLGPTVAHDNFLIATAPAPSKIYRYQLTLASATPSFTCTLRGSTQAPTLGAGQTALITLQGPGADNVSLQTAATVGSTRVSQWYGFGRQEWVEYRIDGIPSTTAPYVVTLSRAEVAPIQVGGPLVPGPITFSRASGVSSNMDMWLFDAGYRALAGMGHAGNGSMTRTLGPGVYYLAVALDNVEVGLPSPGDSTLQNGNVADCPDIAIGSSPLKNINLSVTITDAQAPWTSFASTGDSFEVEWFQFTVGQVTTACNPADIVGVGQSPPGDGLLTGDDYVAFINAFFTGSLLADVVAVGQQPPGDGLLTGDDYVAFINAFFTGCGG